MLENQPLAAKNSGDAVGVFHGNHDAEVLDGPKETKHAKREEGNKSVLHHRRTFNDFTSGAGKPSENFGAI